jgi:hypothetical protein
MRAIALLLILLAGVSSASAQNDSDQILAELSAVRLDKAQIYRIRDITIRRDAISIAFNRGTIAFLEPVRGRITGAVFMGSGEIISLPPDPVEKQQMHRFTGAALLNEAFSTAIFRFSDDTYDEIIREYRARAIEDVEPGDADSFGPWETSVAERSTGLNYRLLPDFLSTESNPFFFAEVMGEKLGWFNVTFDPRMVEEVVVVRTREASASVPYDLWSSFNRRSEARDPEAAANENKLLLDISSYDIDATISAETQLNAKTTIRGKALRSGERLVSFDLSRLLRVSSVTIGSGDPVRHYQPDNFGAVVVVLPKPLSAGENITLTFEYSGSDVIEKRGTGIFYVGDRGLWYPNLGMRDRAVFNLTFHYPVNYNLVATGARQREWEEGGLRHSNWNSKTEFGVAGFNLGDFTILSDESGPVPIFVSVNNDVEPIYKEIAMYRAARLEAALRAASTAMRRGRVAVSEVPAPTIVPDYSVYDTRVVAQNVLSEIRATTAYFSELFGPYPYEHLTISQFPVNYSQGWPSLVYLSTLSFFDRTQRERLGIGSDTLFLYTELMRAHEIAHQWFGNKVGWASYRDQWIPEAFANYAGMMYVENKYQNPAQIREILDASRDALLEKGSDGFTNDTRGPVAIGYRLTSAEAPDAYMDTVYNKGTWIVHMLRTLLGEEAFRAMVKDFLQAYDGKLASTWDLKRIIEKHAGQPMDWFFDQWVFGTGIPKYQLEYKVAQAREGFAIEGEIRQEGVPDTFMMPVPLYADNALLGLVEVSGESAGFRFVVNTRPERVLLDPQETVLRIKD